MNLVWFDGEFHGESNGTYGFPIYQRLGCPAHEDYVNAQLGSLSANARVNNYDIGNSITGLWKLNEVMNIVWFKAEFHGESNGTYSFPIYQRLGCLAQENYVHAQLGSLKAVTPALTISRGMTLRLCYGFMKVERGHEFSMIRCRISWGI